MSAIEYPSFALRAPSTGRRLETIAIAIGICLPVPLLAATGLSVPLPNVVERIAAALVPWAEPVAAETTARGARSCRPRPRRRLPASLPPLCSDRLRLARRLKRDAQPRLRERQPRSSASASRGQPLPLHPDFRRSRGGSGLRPGRGQPTGTEPTAAGGDAPAPTPEPAYRQPVSRLLAPAPPRLRPRLPPTPARRRRLRPRSGTDAVDAGRGFAPRFRRRSTRSSTR